MKAIIFATNNQHKADEVRSVVGDKFQIKTLKDAGIDIDIPEPFDTLEENAITKAVTIATEYHCNVFSEDTGLEVDALNGEPGVRSARYAGDTKDFQGNIDKLMQKLGAAANRRARFRTVICLLMDGKQYLFEGVCTGNIIAEQKGTSGFGYDPVFVPEGSDRTFAEMTMQEKNTYSHRRKAMDQLLAFLSSQ